VNQNAKPFDDFMNAQSKAGNNKPLRSSGRSNNKNNTSTSMSNNSIVGRKNIIKKDNNLQTITLIPSGKGNEIHPNLRSLDYSSNNIGITDPDVVLKESNTQSNQNRKRGVSGRKRMNNGGNQNVVNTEKDDMVNLMSLDQSQDNFQFLHKTDNINQFAKLPNHGKKGHNTNGP
tara:strand:+ start:1465 stop:1986 length:522 start_codon:yes stop_codon:yes gene_type:complete